MAVAEPLNIYLGAGTEALRLHMGMVLKSAGALGVGRYDGRLHGGLRVGLCRRHGGLLNIWRVGGTDGGNRLGVWSSIV